MVCGFRTSLPVFTGIFILACLAGPAAAVSIGSEWKDLPYTENGFTSVRFSDNESLVYAGGDQVLLRSWDGTRRWGGQPGFVAAASGSGNHVAHANGNALTLREQTMAEDWTHHMDGQIKAIALSRNGTYIISGDDQGTYYVWADYGSILGFARTDKVKQLAFSPKDDFVIATTRSGIVAFSPLMAPVWTDNRSKGLDNAILISADGSTIITSGGNQLTSHTRSGQLNWIVSPTTNAITDMGCNFDCSLVAVTSQDGTVQALDRSGKTVWTYNAGQWMNAVGVSSDASIIAAGGLDGTLYLISRTGKTLTTKKLSTAIRPQSLAITRDGKRIAVADLNYLYGLTVLGDPAPAVAEPVPTRTTVTIPQTTAIMASGTPVPATTVPATPDVPAATPLPPQPTQKSPAGPAALAGALAMGIVLIRKKRT